MTDIFSGLGSFFDNLFGAFNGGAQAPAQQPNPQHDADLYGSLFAAIPDRGRKLAESYQPTRQPASWEVPTIQSVVMSSYGDDRPTQYRTEQAPQAAPIEYRSDTIVGDTGSAIPKDVVQGASNNFLGTEPGSSADVVRMNTSPRILTPMEVDAATGNAPALDQRFQHANVNPRMRDRFGALQSVLGETLSVNSVYRDPTHNAAVGGAKHSQHTHGNAVDINVADWPEEKRLNLIKTASSLGFGGIGVYANSIHIDVGNTRTWGPDHSNRSVPAWARATVNKHLRGDYAMAATATPSAKTLNVNFSPTLNAVIDRNAKAAGIDPAIARQIAMIESSGNPNNTTGSYKGLFQLSDSEFKKYGGGNIYNAEDNARAGLKKIAAERAQLAKIVGREVSPGEVYLAHQQGVGGAAQHLRNPNQPAWLSMFQTGEGRAKGQAWAKRAIWGNVPDNMKRIFGSVENITSGQFTQLWTRKVEGK